MISDSSLKVKSLMLTIGDSCDGFQLGKPPLLSALS